MTENSVTWKEKQIRIKRKKRNVTGSGCAAFRGCTIHCVPFFWNSLAARGIYMMHLKKRFAALRSLYLQ